MTTQKKKALSCYIVDKDGDNKSRYYSMQIESPNYWDARVSFIAQGKIT